MASVIFIHQQSTASCFSLGLRVAMATPAVETALAEDTQWACRRLTANRKVLLYLPICSRNAHKADLSYERLQIYSGYRLCVNG